MCVCVYGGGGEGGGGNGNLMTIPLLIAVCDNNIFPYFYKKI